MARVTKAMGVARVTKALVPVKVAGVLVPKVASAMGTRVVKVKATGTRGADLTDKLYCCNIILNSEYF